MVILPVWLFLSISSRAWWLSTVLSTVLGGTSSYPYSRRSRKYPCVPLGPNTIRHYCHDGCDHGIGMYDPNPGTYLPPSLALSLSLTLFLTSVILRVFGGFRRQLLELYSILLLLLHFLHLQHPFVFYHLTCPISLLSYLQLLAISVISG